MKKWISILMLAGGLLRATEPTGVAGKLLLADDFKKGLAGWVVEQLPGGTVSAENGRLVINDTGGCTVWLREPLKAPLMITYRAKASSANRVSDLNCFWMACDPARADDIFAPGHTRTGKFSTYDSLRLYYVGYGGNNNTTTRFRRYDGTGTRPLLPEHDLSAPEFLLQPDHEYQVALLVTANGQVQFIRDSKVIFDWHDPAPLLSGWFGFRTVKSQLEIRDFKVHELVAPAVAAAQ